MMPTSAADRSGFTLLEMLVVLTLLALVAATVAPQADRGGETLAVRDAAATIAAALTEARDRALATGRTTMVTLDPASRALIDADRRQTKFEPPLALAVADTRGPAPLRFFADGSASDAVIRVSSGPASADVRVDGMTGRIRR